MLYSLRRAGFSLVFLISYGYASLGQDTLGVKSVPKIEIFVFEGKSLPHHPEMKELCKNPYFGTEIRLGWQTTGGSYWHQAYKYPTYGIGYYVANFNQKAIGYPMALFSYLELPFYRSKNTTLSTSWSAGVAFHINEFDSLSNPENMAIGSDANAYIDFSVLYRQKLNEQLQLGCGLKIQHFSNGAIRLPNWGLNMVGAQLVISYLPAKTIPGFTLVSKPEIKKKNEFYVMYAGGFRYKNNDTYLKQYYNSTISIAASRRVSYKRTVGIGIDIFYNEYFINKFSPDETIGMNKLVSQSVFVTSDMIVNKFRMAVCFGLYTFRYDDYTLPFYERVALRYYFIPNMFANVSIKAHAAKAEFVEWGLGFSF